MKLAIIGDLHYPDALTCNDSLVTAARDAYYELFMDKFLSITADYHISIGDLTHAGEFSEFKYVMNHVENSQLEGRFLHVLGNHDTYTYSKKVILSLTKQKRYEFIEEQDALILLLDTARETREDWSGTIDEEQWSWIEEQLSRRSDKPLFVFGHHPLYGTTARSTEPMMSLDPDLDIWSLLQQWQGIGFYFNGHNHVNSIVKKEQWHFIQTAAVPDIPAVRIVTVDNNMVSLETISLANNMLAEWARAFTANMYDYEIHPNGEGEPSARELIVCLDKANGGIPK